MNPGQSSNFSKLENFKYSLLGNGFFKRPPKTSSSADKDLQKYSHQEDYNKWRNNDKQQ